jgi:hypothetical protein
MALGYILRRVAAEAGLGNLATNPGQRLRAIDIVNEACEDLWEEVDAPGSLEEAIFLVQADNELALPPFVGVMRAMREKALMKKWTLKDMRPRYQQEPWENMWRNWRVKGKSPIQATIQNAAPLTFSMAVPDNSVITVTGATAQANFVGDSVTMSASQVVGNLSFIDIESITKKEVNTGDVIITDVLGNVLSIFTNDALDSMYLIVDVSQYPFGGETMSGSRVMEVLFKRPLKRLINDTDTYPIPEWDKIIVNKTLQIMTESQEGKEQRAQLYAQKTQLLARNKVNHQEGGMEKEVQYAENPFYGMTKRPYSRIWRG